jgi:hypothetical protein
MELRQLLLTQFSILGTTWAERLLVFKAAPELWRR